MIMEVYVVYSIIDKGLDKEDVLIDVFEKEEDAKKYVSDKRNVRYKKKEII